MLRAWKIDKFQIIDYNIRAIHRLHDLNLNVFAQN